MQDNNVQPIKHQASRLLDGLKPGEKLWKCSISPCGNYMVVQINNEGNTQDPKKWGSVTIKLYQIEGNGSIFYISKIRQGVKKGRTF